MVRVPPPGPPPGSGQLQLIRFRAGTTVLPFVLSIKMPLARHCHALSWISHEEAGKAATSSHIKRLSGRGWGGGSVVLILLICMRRIQVGETKIDRRGKRGREMSIKDPGRAEISIERRTSKINCWEKMQTKCFCSGERDRIRTDCSHAAGPWICSKCCNFTDIVAKSRSQFACPQKPKDYRLSAGCFCCSRSKRHAFFTQKPFGSEVGHCEPVRMSQSELRRSAS